MALWPVEVRRTARGQGDKAKVSRADRRVTGFPIKCTWNQRSAGSAQRREPQLEAAAAADSHT